MVIFYAVILLLFLWFGYNYYTNKFFGKKYGFWGMVVMLVVAIAVPLLGDGIPFIPDAIEGQVVGYTAVTAWTLFALYSLFKAYTFKPTCEPEEVERKGNIRMASFAIGWGVFLYLILFFVAFR